MGEAVGDVGEAVGDVGEAMGDVGEAVGDVGDSRSRDSKFPGMDAGGGIGRGHDRGT